MEIFYLTGWGLISWKCSTCHTEVSFFILGDTWIKQGFKASCSINFYWMCLFKDVQPFLQIWEMNSSEYSTTQSGTVVFCISRLHKSVKDGRACATLHFFKFNLYLHKLCKHNPCTLMRVFGNFWVTCKVGNLIRDTPSVSFR